MAGCHCHSNPKDNYRASTSSITRKQLLLLPLPHSFYFRLWHFSFLISLGWKKKKAENDAEGCGHGTIANVVIVLAFSVCQAELMLSITNFLAFSPSARSAGENNQRMENVMKWVNVDAERFSEWKWSFYVCAPRSHSLWQMILMCVILVTFDYRQNIRAKLLSLDQQIAEFYVGFACVEYGGNYKTIDDISVGHTNWPIRMMSRIAPNAHRMAAHTDHKIQK